MDGPAGDDLVFKALADPTRRAILDALFAADGQSLGALCDHLAATGTDMTRFGVMKHVRVLADAGLVTTHKSGRVTHHFLNPVPLHAVAARWLHKYSLPVTGAMLGLRHELEATGLGADPTSHTAQQRTTP